VEGVSSMVSELRPQLDRLACNVLQGVVNLGVSEHG
jgi:hypothetical protein